MKIYIIVILITILFSGCSDSRKIEHELNCVLHSVINTKSGNEVVFTRKDAVANGYEYHFVVYDQGTMIVNAQDVYKQEKDDSYTYSLVLDGKVLHNMQFQFKKIYSDVEFNIQKRSEKYIYDCVTVNTK